MDSITHIALGAAVGEIVIGKKIGKRALIIGAIANSFPDIDFIASLWLSPADNLMAHRGMTHSLLFITLISLLFYWMAIRWDKQCNVSHQRWFLFFLLQLGLHLFMDAFNAYGVGWFIPFNDMRISFHSIFVVDPFYSVLLILVLLLLFLAPLTYKHRTRIAAIGLITSTIYLGYALINKYVVNKESKELLAKQNITYHRFFTTPTPLNTWLWFVVAEADSGYHIGYRSVFDETNDLPLTFIPKNEHLLDGLESDHDLEQLKKFSQGYFTVDHYSDTLVFNDLRFGQITGWHNPSAPFVFHYYLNHPDENLLVMQRGRFANWNEETVRSLLARIQGNP
jgi:inner membrane protein